MQRFLVIFRAGLTSIFCDAYGNFLDARTSILSGIPLVKECEALALLEAVCMGLDFKVWYLNRMTN